SRTRGYRRRRGLACNVSVIDSSQHGARMIPLLDGLRILDLTTVILGPYATQILGDLGADVVKVEPPEGDSMRPVAPVAAPGISAIFANNNRNKRSIALDLKSEAGRAALFKLLPTADVLVHNMRQEAMDKLGLTFNAVRAANPKIIYAAAVGVEGKAELVHGLLAHVVHKHI